MSKYIPKVGEQCEWKSELGGFINVVTPILVTDKQLVYKVGSGLLNVLSLSHEFRPIPTKADVEREQLTRLISDSYSRCTGPDYCAKNIIKAGFTIPKKVKRSEIADVVANTSPMISVEDLVDEICNLLGDLVEE